MKRIMQWGNSVGDLFEFDWMMKSGFVILLVNIFPAYIESVLSLTVIFPLSR